MKKLDCPRCGKELIRLEPYEECEYDFWCDKCNLDITIIDNDLEKECNNHEKITDHE